MTLKSSTRDISKRPGKLTKGVLFHQLLHTILWLQLLMCVTAALNLLATLHILLIWHHLTIFSSQHEKTLGWETVTDL